MSIAQWDYENSHFFALEGEIKNLGKKYAFTIEEYAMVPLILENILRKSALPPFRERLLKPHEKKYLLGEIGDTILAYRFAQNILK